LLANMSSYILLSTLLKSIFVSEIHDLNFCILVYIIS
jgi:hypothetical protein